VVRPRREQAARCGAIVEGGGVGTTRMAWLTVGPKRDGEGRSSAARCDVRQHGEAVSPALTGGASSTVRLIQFSNRIKFISNGFKFAPNFDR
jgi:hypothetical protein